MRDYATEYAKAVVSGKKEMACKAEVLVCKRHLQDIERAKKHQDGLEWRPDIAEKFVKFAELLKIYIKNERRYVPLQLRGFQRFIICSLFGWYQNGIRRFTESYIQMARKNSKSFLNGYLCLVYSTLLGVKNGQIYCAGTKFDNAKFVFDACKELIEADKNLSQYFTIKDYGDSRSVITNKKNGTKIKALSGDNKQDGRQGWFCAIDEMHLAEDDEMVNNLLDSQVGLNGSCLSIITTAGKNLNGPCYRKYKYCKQVLAGTINQDNWFIYIVEVDLPDAHKEGHEKEYYDALWDKRRWAQANPLLLYDDDYHVTRDVNKWKDFLDIAERARREEGSTLNNFIIKKLDVWSTIGSESFVDAERFASCGIEPIDVSGKRCFIGLDLSSKNDLASFSAVFPPQDGMNLPYIYSHSFLPKGTLEKHIQKDKVPYDRWAMNGYLSLTDCNGTNGFILDYKFIAEYLKSFIRENRLQVAMIGYDGMGIQGIMQDLDEIPCEKVEIVQTPKSLNETCRHFRGTVEGKQLSYDKHNELLAWSVVNAISVVNSSHELLIDKKMQRNRIDPVDAVLDGWKCMLLTDKDAIQKEKDLHAVDEWLQIMSNL